MSSRAQSPLSIRRIPGSSLLTKTPNDATDNARPEERIRSSIVKLLRACFPELQDPELSSEQVLQDGIGFHDLTDTTWILLLPDNNKHLDEDDGDVANNQQVAIVGLVTAIVYHNGLYLCNLCVDPAMRRSGHGLDLFEAASYFAVESFQNNNNSSQDNNKTLLLIGNANADNPYILGHYQRLGAQRVTAGVMGGTAQARFSSIRLQREIPTTLDGVQDFFSGLKLQRRRRRLWWWWWGGGSAAALITTVGVLFMVGIDFSSFKKAKEARRTRPR